MAQTESKHEAMLKKLQLWLAVLVGVTTLIVGAYNVKKLLFPAKALPGQLTFVVQDDGSRAIGNARVELLDGQSVLIATLNTGSDGRAASETLDPVSYLIKSSKSGYEPQALAVRVLPGKISEIIVTLRAIASAPNQKEAPDPIKAALEETGASLIRNFGSRVSKTTAEQQKAEAS